MSAHAEVANTIKKQMGVGGMMTVGAHQFFYTKGEHGMGALTFKARLHYTDQSRVRICRVTISLSPMDYYDVLVQHADKWGVVQREAKFTDVDAFSLTGLMLDLDSKGI